MISGTFAGDYSDKLLHALVAACETKEKPQLDSFGRELQPYFSLPCPEGASGFSALEQAQASASVGKDAKALSESGRKSSMKQKLPRKPPGDPKGSPQASVSNKRTKRALRGSSPRYVSHLNSCVLRFLLLSAADPFRGVQAAFP